MPVAVLPLGAGAWILHAICLPLTWYIVPLHALNHCLGSATLSIVLLPKKKSRSNKGENVVAGEGATDFEVLLSKTNEGPSTILAHHALALPSRETIADYCQDYWPVTMSLIRRAVYSRSFQVTYACVLAVYLIVPLNLAMFAVVPANVALTAFASLAVLLPLMIAALSLPVVRLVFWAMPSPDTISRELIVTAWVAVAVCLFPKDARLAIPLFAFLGIQLALVPDALQPQVASTRSSLSVTLVLGVSSVACGLWFSAIPDLHAQEVEVHTQFGTRSLSSLELFKSLTLSVLLAVLEHAVHVLRGKSAYRFLSLSRPVQVKYSRLLRHGEEPTTTAAERQDMQQRMRELGIDAEHVRSAIEAMSKTSQQHRTVPASAIVAQSGFLAQEVDAMFVFVDCVQVRESDAVVLHMLHPLTHALDRVAIAALVHPATAVASSVAVGLFCGALPTVLLFDLFGDSVRRALACVSLVALVPLARNGLLMSRALLAVLVHRVGFVIQLITVTLWSIALAFLYADERAVCVLPIWLAFVEMRLSDASVTPFTTLRRVERFLLLVGALVFSVLIALGAGGHETAQLVSIRVLGSALTMSPSALAATMGATLAIQSGGRMVRALKEGKNVLVEVRAPMMREAPRREPTLRPAV